MSSRGRARWLGARPGIESQIILTFTLLLVTAMGVLSWQFLGQMQFILPEPRDVQIRRIAKILAIDSTVALILVLPLLSIFVHRAFHPIRRLVAATKRIAAGKLDTQIDLNRRDSVGVLARCMNEMVGHIKGQQDELEHRIRQRTAELEAANQQLSAEIAEKEDFLRAVSHDLNAPLRNIAGMAMTLLANKDSHFHPDVVHRLQRIQKNVDVEIELIGELLELSRIKTRRQTMEPVDIASVVHELGEMFDDDLKRRRIELVVDTALPVLTAERARIRQVFQNLIDNAIKYMGEDAPERPAERTIHIGCTRCSTEVEFYVRDTGIGIDPEDLDKVFYVFRRGRHSAVQNIPGKGVGLASVKSIVETYAGRIWAQSVPGKGSKFIFTINGKFIAQPPQPSISLVA